MPIPRQLLPSHPAHESEEPTNAHPHPHPERQKRPLHALQLLLARLQPPLGPVLVGVLSVDRAIALDDPGIDADDGAAGEGLVTQHGARGGDDAVEREADDWMETEGFFDGCLAEGLLVAGCEVI